MRTKRCSCGAELPWAKTVNGRMMLVEAKPGGNVVMQTTIESPDEPLAMVVTPGSGTHQAHFASCPDAEMYRRRGGSIGEPDQGGDDD